MCNEIRRNTNNWAYKNGTVVHATLGRVTAHLTVDWKVERVNVARVSTWAVVIGTKTEDGDL